MEQTQYETVETGVGQEYRSYKSGSCIATILEITNQSAADTFDLEGPTFYQVIIQTPFDGYRRDYRTIGGRGVYNTDTEALEVAKEAIAE